MSSLPGFLLRMPLKLFVGGLELLLRTVREFQTSYDATTETLINGSAELLRGGKARATRVDDGVPQTDQVPVNQASPPGEDATKSGQLASVGQANSSSSSRKEPDVSDWNQNKDLSSDDLKLVSYTIIFTKRDFEATLYHGREQVNWSTREGGFAGRKIYDFLELLNRGRRLPDEWQGGNQPPGEYGYDDEQEPTTYSAIPQVDRKYIDFIHEVEDRRPKREQEYDKEQARAQQDLADNIKRLADSL